MDNKKIVMTYYYTGMTDKWHHKENKMPKKADAKEFSVLYDSVAGRGYDFVTLANELEADWTVEKIEKPEYMSLYTHKFIACYEYLLKHPEYEEIWITDTNDVEMLTLPCPAEDRIYTGYDAFFPAFDRYVNFLWFLGGISKYGVYVPQGFGRGQEHGDAEVRYLRDVHLYDTPYNCGIFGGKRKIVMEFLKDYTDRLRKNDITLEMVPFNYLCYTKYKNKVVNCATRMTLGEKDYNKWWRHK